MREITYDRIHFSKKRILITGGLGLIGSNIIHQLSGIDAVITVIDSLNPLQGGNLFNIAGLPDQIKNVKGDVRNKPLIEELVTGQDYIFHLAAQVNYIDSTQIPFEDLDVNCVGLLTVLEACRKRNPTVKILFASSRMVLGKTVRNPITEDHPTRPLTLYGIHKLTGEQYLSLYHGTYGIRTTILRIANPYGERQQIKHSKYSLPGWFMRCAMEGKEIRIFGNGRQLRDYIYVTDVADAFLRVAASPKSDGEIFNCGSGKSHEFRHMVEMIVKVVGRGKVTHIPWPQDYERIETGDYVLDITKLKKMTGWAPQVGLEEGIRRMFEFYKKHLKEYLI